MLRCWGANTCALRLFTELGEEYNILFCNIWEKLQIWNLKFKVSKVYGETLQAFDEDGFRFVAEIKPRGRVKFWKIASLNADRAFYVKTTTKFYLFPLRSFILEFFALQPLNLVWPRRRLLLLPLLCCIWDCILEYSLVMSNNFFEFANHNICKSFFRNR